MEQDFLFFHHHSTRSFTFLSRMSRCTRVRGREINICPSYLGETLSMWVGSSERLGLGRVIGTDKVSNGPQHVAGLTRGHLPFQKLCMSLFYSLLSFGSLTPLPLASGYLLIHSSVGNHLYGSFVSHLHHLIIEYLQPLWFLGE